MNIFMIVQYITVLHSTVHHCTVLCSTSLYCTLQYITVQHNTVQWCTVQYSTSLYCTIQHITVRHSTVNHCTTQHYITLLHSTVHGCTYSTAHDCTLQYSTWLYFTVQYITGFPYLLGPETISTSCSEFSILPSRRLSNLSLQNLGENTLDSNNPKKYWHNTNWQTDLDSVACHLIHIVIHFLVFHLGLKRAAGNLKKCERKDGAAWSTKQKEWCLFVCLTECGGLLLQGKGQGRKALFRKGLKMWN